jgi:5-methylcytosine-specific restriction protein B
MDETTHSFSRKVLDRAMTIEMNEVQLDQGLQAGDQVWKYPRKFYGKDLVCGFPMPIAEIYKGYKKAVDVIDHLKEVNNILENTPFKIAYRVRDEALAYCYHHAKLYGGDEDPWLEVALDEITHMKILPRIEGDEAKCRTPLMGLLAFFDEKKMQSSVRKVKEMLDRLKFGYTSYFP